VKCISVVVSACPVLCPFISEYRGFRELYSFGYIEVDFVVGGWIS